MNNNDVKEDFSFDDIAISERFFSHNKVKKENLSIGKNKVIDDIKKPENIEAEKIKEEQISILSQQEVKQEYETEIASLIQGKTDQAERIIDRLKTKINDIESKINNSYARKPSFLSFPKAKENWKKENTENLKVLDKVKQRLSGVDNIKKDMQKISLLAKDKLKFEQPDLSISYQSIVKIKQREKQEEEKKIILEKYQEKNKKRNNSISRALGISEFK